MKQLDNFQRACVEKAIDKLFNDNHFSICAIDQIGKMIGVNPQQFENYKFLRGLHCVNYSDMSKDILDNLPQVVMQCFTPKVINPTQFLNAIMAEGNDFAGTEDRFLEHRP